MLQLLKRHALNTEELDTKDKYTCTILNKDKQDISQFVYAIDIEANENLLTPIVRIIYFFSREQIRDSNFMDQIAEIEVRLSKGEQKVLKIPLEAIEYVNKKENPISFGIQSEDFDLISYTVIYGILGSRKFSDRSKYKVVTSKVSEVRKVISQLTSNIYIEQNSFEDIPKEYETTITETKIPKQILLLLESLLDKQTLTGQQKTYETNLSYASPKDQLVQVYRKFYTDARLINPFRFGFNLAGTFEVYTLRDKFNNTFSPLKLMSTGFYSDMSRVEDESECYSRCIYLNERIVNTEISPNYVLCNLDRFQIQFNVSHLSREEHIILDVRDIFNHVFGNSWSTIHNKLVRDFCDQKDNVTTDKTIIDTLTANKNSRQRVAVTLYNMLYTTYTLNTLILENLPDPDFFATSIWSKIEVYTMVKSSKYYWLPMFVSGYRLTGIRISPASPILATDVQLVIKSPFGYLMPAQISNK